MREHLLLYLDILGFSELVRTPRRVMQMYRIINSLNVHRHTAFRAIVFSDTLLVYSKLDTRDAGTRDYSVMFLCEFARDLLHRTAGRNFYFRGLVTHGHFHHEQMRNLDAFFGSGLVEAFRYETTIKCTGLFIDDYCNRSNNVFKTRPYSPNCSFVYLTQALGRLCRARGNRFPAPGELIADTDAEFGLIWEIAMLADVHRKMLSHSSPDVRAKFLATWSYYEQEYPELMKALEEGRFEPTAVVAYDWALAQKAFRRDRRETYDSPVWTR